MTGRDKKRDGQKAKINRIMQRLMDCLTVTAAADEFDLVPPKEVMALRDNLLLAKVAANNISIRLGDPVIWDPPVQEYIGVYLDERNDRQTTDAHDSPGDTAALPDSEADD